VKLWIVLVALLAAPAQGQQCYPMQWVGNTPSHADWWEGYPAVVAECQQWYGSEARPCAYDEFVSTVTLPPIPQDRPGRMTGQGGENCNTWSAGPGFASGVVDEHGEYFLRVCDQFIGYWGMACCAPVPLPEPSAWLPGAALVFALWRRS